MNTEAAAVRKFKLVDSRIIAKEVPPSVWIWSEEIATKGIEGTKLFYKMSSDGLVVHEAAKNMMRDSKFVVTPPQIIKAACCEVGDLDFPKHKNSVPVPEFFVRLREIKGIFQQVDAGPSLLYRFGNRPVGEWAIVAMEPISMSFTNSGIFLLRCNNDGKRNKKIVSIDGCAVGDGGSIAKKLKLIIAVQ